MTKNPKEKPPLRGWLEVLLCMKPTPLKSAAELDLDNYFPVEGKITLPEFYGPYALYENQFELDFTKEPPAPILGVDGKLIPKMQDGKPAVLYGMPRRFQQFDVINLIARREGSKKITVVSMMMLRELDNRHLIEEFPNAQVQARRGGELVGLILNTPFYDRTRI